MKSRSKSFIKKKDLKQSQSECIDAFNRKLTKKYVGIPTHSVEIAEIFSNKIFAKIT